MQACSAFSYDWICRAESLLAVAETKGAPASQGKEKDSLRATLERAECIVAPQA